MQIFEQLTTLLNRQLTTYDKFPNPNNVYSLCPCEFIVLDSTYKCKGRCLSICAFYFICCNTSQFHPHSPGSIFIIKDKHSCICGFSYACIDLDYSIPGTEP